MTDRGVSLRRAALRRFLRRPSNLVSVVFLVLVVIAALWPTSWLPHDPTASDLAARLRPPAWLDGGSWSYVLGTDNIGRDVFSRIVLGSRWSLVISGTAVVIAAVLGITAGVIAGYRGGWVDSITMRAVDVQLAFPVIILVIAVVGVVGTGITQLILVMGVTGWAQYARIVRGSTLSIRNQDYVEAAVAQGASAWRIMTRDILPNLASEIIVLTSFNMARLLLLESGLSFLGLGIQPPRPSWGGMVGDARDYLQSGWWILAFAGGTIALAVLSFNFLGDGIRDALDPRTRHVGTAQSAEEAAS
ncbi:MAG: ABC transporter permease [Acidimicrobiia bacterium]|nr:ABC transporter permease [Acidimicrobiia bacterium]NNF10578.1 ABC transporter permease [Acidimicrobiia bacterium]NNL70725.1 ABC transporter permease [Acidimicrobiia bacterium]